MIWRSPLAFALVFLVLAGGCGERSIDRHLSDAAATGNVREIKRFLAEGANVNCRDHSLAAWTPLIWALFEHEDGAAQALLAAGADPNLSDSAGKAPLSYAMGLQDRSATIRALILAGAKTQDYVRAFKVLPSDDPNRLAFEEAVRLQAGKSRVAPNSPAKERGTNGG